MTTINATELFDRTNRAFVGLRERAADTMRETPEGVTMEWARLYAKGTAVANANAVFHAQFEDADANNLPAVAGAVGDILDKLIAEAEKQLVEADEADKVAGFRNAIAQGHLEGYKVARGYFIEELTYFGR